MDRNTTFAPSALALVLTLALSACQEPEDSGKGPSVDAAPSALQVKQIGRPAGDSLLQDSDPYRLDSAGIEGDSLIVHVTLGGGCREHVFTLYSSEYTYLSSPSGKDLWLHHEGHDDNCKALLFRRLAYGLGTFQGTEPGGFLQFQRHPSDSGQPLMVRMPPAPLRYPLRMLSPDGADSLAAGSDPLEVAGHRLDGDTLRIQVRFGGGCRRHLFTPYVSDVAAFSYPPQFTVWIHHDSDEDPCEAYASAELALDVGELVRDFPQAPRFHVLPLSDLR